MAKPSSLFRGWIMNAIVGATNCQVFVRLNGEQRKLTNAEFNKIRDQFNKEDCKLLDKVQGAHHE